MRKFLSVVFVFAAAMMAGCGGSDDTLVGTAPPPGGGPVVDISSLSVLTSSPNIPSDGALPATITALVQDVNNNVVEGVTVIFSADSGGLAVTEPVTNNSGVASAELTTAGDPANRTITITAQAGSLTSTIAVDVTGTQLAISGAPSLVQGAMETYTIVLTDAGGNGIANQTVDVTSANGNSLASTTLTTGVGGEAQVELTADNAGDDMLTASALGLDATQEISVSNDSFTVSSTNSEVNLNVDETVTVEWISGGVAQANQPINFSTTRGTILQAQPVMTNVNGRASVTVNSTNAGPGIITATAAVPDGPAASLEIEFIATIADSMELQANPFTLAPNEQSAITSIVRDPNNNLVKGKLVDFVLDDVTGGALSVASAFTDSQGRAQTFYTASTTTSASDGVIITALVQDTPAVTDSVALTVAQRELFMSLGTGNEIFEPNSAQYRKEYVVQVTDAEGNGVEGVDVQVSILSNLYGKGRYVLGLTGPWQLDVRITCVDEDINNRNGVLDPGEDQNNSGNIEAGNIATATAQVGGGGSLITDVNGFGLIDVLYPQEFANWVNVTLETKTAVQGTEFAQTSVFWLPIAASDVNNRDSSPPGNPSPFGVAATCASLN